MNLPNEITAKIFKYIPEMLQIISFQEHIRHCHSIMNKSMRFKQTYHVVFFLKNCDLDILRIATCNSLDIAEEILLCFVENIDVGQLLYDAMQEDMTTIYITPKIGFRMVTQRISVPGVHGGNPMFCYCYSAKGLHYDGIFDKEGQYLSGVHKTSYYKVYEWEDCVRDNGTIVKKLATYIYEMIKEYDCHIDIPKNAII